jgi:hypothetical protein
MTLLWAFFGFIVGFLTAPPEDPVALVAGIIAGMLVLSPLGAILGLLGGRLNPTLIGAIGGVGLGLLASAFSPINPAFLLGAGLIVGGLAGATGSVFFAFAFFLLRVTAPAGRGS